ncbi:sugar transporter [Microvirga sp. KLBC 81]|uniref:polysaccharide biosynthesis/export family protein n=1 Tax=Microvirga sp. KLBC 81 TaxID=1862707 RepID=UPI000D51B822|nr:polysaccharide biosynthesis/export family protein [Microvirga sp. KLBC 81]PVE21800.1 sugar transporter [Microvirga sp. KLBC 81]
MSLVRMMALVLALTGAPAQVYALDDTKGGYVLGPQDRLMIRVHTLRKNAAEIYSWAALNGEFSVGADGAVSLPILGEVKAVGETTAKLAEVISRTLKQTADLAETPSASVEVIRYRPFFVIGAVQQPGKYDFEPGLTVLKALSTAQGILRSADVTGVEREIVTTRGKLRSLDAERVTLEAKLVRLSAELSDAQAVTYPAELAERAADPRAVRAMQEETLRFEARRNALNSEIEAIEKSKVLLKQELTSLEVKTKSLDRLLDMSRKELDVVNGLVAKGLTVTPRQLAAENSQASIESNRLDVQVATLRAQQGLARADRDSVEVRARYRKEALDDTAVIRSRLDQIAEEVRTLERLLYNAEMQSPGFSDDDKDPVPTFDLTRVTPSGPVTWTAGEGDAILPGDVLRVSLPRDSRRRGASDPKAAASSRATVQADRGLSLSR